jgi:hypothetical protein
MHVAAVIAQHSVQQPAADGGAIASTSTFESTSADPRARLGTSADAVEGDAGSGCRCGVVCVCNGGAGSADGCRLAFCGGHDDENKTDGGNRDDESRVRALAVLPPELIDRIFCALDPDELFLAAEVCADFTR